MSNKELIEMNSRLNDIEYLNTNGSLAKSDYLRMKKDLNSRINDLKQEDKKNPLSTIYVVTAYTLFDFWIDSVWDDEDKANDYCNFKQSNRSLEDMLDLQYCIKRMDCVKIKRGNQWQKTEFLVGNYQTTAIRY